VTLNGTLEKAKYILLYTVMRSAYHNMKPTKKKVGNKEHPEYL